MEAKKEQEIESWKLSPHIPGFMLLDFCLWDVRSAGLVNTQGFNVRSQSGHSQVTVRSTVRSQSGHVKTALNCTCAFLKLNISNFLYLHHLNLSQFLHDLTVT